MRIALACCLLVTATAASAQGFLGRLLTGDDTVTPPFYDRDFRPAMDDPPLPWFTYDRDSFGRPTFLSRWCLTQSRASQIKWCVHEEIRVHQELIIKHDKDLVEAQAKAEQKRVADEIAERERQQQIKQEQANPDTYLFKIKGLKARKAYLLSLRAREYRAAKVSGYVDKSVLYGIGMQVVMIDDEITQQYRLYRSHGGRKTLAAIASAPN